MPTRILLRSNPEAIIRSVPFVSADYLVVQIKLVLNNNYNTFVSNFVQIMMVMQTVQYAGFVDNERREIGVRKSRNPNKQRHFKHVYNSQHKLCSVAIMREHTHTHHSGRENLNNGSHSVGNKERSTLSLLKKKPKLCSSSNRLGIPSCLLL